jgi:hypothetical protein
MSEPPADRDDIDGGIDKPTRVGVPQGAKRWTRDSRSLATAREGLETIKLTNAKAVRAHFRRSDDGRREDASSSIETEPLQKYTPMVLEGVPEVIHCFQ